MSTFEDVDQRDPSDIFIELRGMLSRPLWHFDALCREYPTLPWVSLRSGPGLPEMQSICGRCLVRSECAADVEHHTFTTFGVWGGKAHRDRPRIRRVA